MTVIICLTIEHGKQDFPHEIGKNTFFFTPTSDNGLLKDVVIEKILISSAVALDLIPIYELCALKNRLKDKSGGSDIFLNHFEGKKKNENPFWIKKRKPFDEKKEKEIVKFWIDEQRGLLENSFYENGAKFFRLNPQEEKEHFDLMNGQWEITKPNNNEK